MKKSKKKTKRIIITVAVLLVLGAAGWLFLGGANGAQGLPVSTGTAEYMDLAQYVSIKGAIEGSETADVASILNYKVTSVLVEEGDRVEAGQTLATLDVDNDVDTTARKQAQVTLAEAKRVYETTKALYEAGATPQSDLLAAEASYETAKIAANAPLAKAEDSRITSPIAGVVTRVNINVGRYASDTEDKQPMFVVENLDQLQMKVKVSEFDISKIRVGQTVEISAEVLGKETVPGTVSYISPTGEPKGDGTAAMVIPVIIDVDKGDTNLIAGVTARAEILIEARENVMTVPIDAILEDPATGESWVFVVGADNLLSKVAVTKGLEGDFNVEVSSDRLQEGDPVVLNPTFELTEGMAVLPDVPVGGVGDAGDGEDAGQDAGEDSEDEDAASAE